MTYEEILGWTLIAVESLLLDQSDALENHFKSESQQTPNYVKEVYNCGLATLIKILSDDNPLPIGEKTLLGDAIDYYEDVKTIAIYNLSDEDGDVENGDPTIIHTFAEIEYEYETLGMIAGVLYMFNQMENVRSSNNLNRFCPQHPL